MYHYMSIAISDPDTDMGISQEKFYMKMRNHDAAINAETGNCANYYSINKDAIQECVVMPEDVEIHITKWMNELGYPLSP